MGVVTTNVPIRPAHQHGSSRRPAGLGNQPWRDRLLEDTTRGPAMSRFCTRFEHGGDGGYRFRTIKPAPYPGRTPHIHFAVVAPGAPRWTTQMYIAGEPGNQTDFLLNRVRDPERRARLIVPLRAAEDIEPGALAGRFDIVGADFNG